MPKSKQRRHLIIIALAALAVSAVGCGDAQHKGSRNRGNRTIPRGTRLTQQNQNKPLNPGLKPGTNPSPAGRGGAVNTPVLPKPGDEAKGKRMDQIWAGLQNGATKVNNVKDLADGTYKLDGTASELKLITQPMAETIRAVQVFQLNGEQLAATAEGESMGLLVNDDDGHGRELEIPGAFTMEQGQLKADVKWFYRTRLVSGGMKLRMEDTVSGVANVVSAALTDLLSGQTTDKLGKTLNLEIAKLQDGSVRFFITIDEVLTGNAVTKKSQMFRRIALTYKLETAPAPAPGPAPEPQPATPTPTIVEPAPN